MTLEEAQKIAKILGTADNGCSTCVGNLLDKMNAAFPMFVWKEGDLVSPSEENDWQASIAVHVSPSVIP